MRYMARVVTVKQVFEIPGKDRVQKATFNENGYEAIISKSIQVGQSVVWIEADSILPDKPQWEFLRKRCWNFKVNGYLIKAIKMFGIKSWGLVVTLDEAGLHNESKMLHPGDDITELLGIRKYEPTEDASPKPRKENKNNKVLKFLLDHLLTRWLGKIVLYFHNKKKNKEDKLKGFPEYIISKSDEDTIQQHTEWLDQYKEDHVYITAKMEGQSVTACFDYNKNKIGQFFVCSRNIAYRTDINNSYWKFAIQNNLKKKLLEYYNKTGKLLCIQAEQCGPNIQQNIYCLPGIKWFVYSIKDEISNTQLSYSEMKAVCDEFGLDTVPLLEYDIPLKDVMGNLENAVKYAENKGFYVEKDNGKFSIKQLSIDTNPHRKLWKDIFLNEGVVVRSINYDKDKNIGVSFKVKNIEYAEMGLGKIHRVVESFVNESKK